MLSVMLHKNYQAVFYKTSQYFPTKTSVTANPFGSDVNFTCTFLIATSGVHQGILTFLRGYLHQSGRIKTDPASSGLIWGASTE